MDVNTLRDRVIELSHDEVAPDTDLQRKALDWLNSAYFEVLDEVRPLISRYVAVEEQLVTTSQGSAQTAQPIRQVLAAVNQTNNTILNQIDKADAAKLSAQQPGNQFTLNGSNTLTLVPPAAAQTLGVVYVPEATALADGGSETSILLPPTFHHALIWGALTWGAIYERAFSSQGDLQLFQRKWETAKQNLKLSLAAQPTRTLRVQQFEWLADRA